MTFALILYFTTLLIPINGLIYLGMRRERERTRKALQGYWKLYNKRAGR